MPVFAFMNVSVESKNIALFSAIVMLSAKFAVPSTSMLSKFAVPFTSISPSKSMLPRTVKSVKNPFPLALM